MILLGVGFWLRFRAVMRYHARLQALDKYHVAHDSFVGQQPDMDDDWRVITWDFSVLDDRT